MWCIWRVRNGCSFEDCERSYIEIKLFFLRSLFDWVDGWGSHPCYFFSFPRALFFTSSLIFVFLVVYYYFFLSVNKSLLLEK